MKQIEFQAAIRRVSVVYLFLVISACLLLFYFYYLVPNQKKDLSERGFRALSTLVENFGKGARDLKSLFGDITLTDKENFANLKDHKGSYQVLYENIPYEVDTAWKGRTNADTLLYNDGWKLVFPIRSRKAAVQVLLADLVNRLFANRNGVFNTYIILSPDSSQRNPLNKVALWRLIYKERAPTISDPVLLDTLQRSFQNSDMSGIVEATIDGKPQKVFLHPLLLNNREVFVGGLVSKEVYDRYIHSIPARYVIFTVIAIVLILIILPLLKIYFLSANETIYAKDVIASIVSVFIGSTAILLILLFTYLYNVSSRSFLIRMNDVADQVKKDIETQLNEASQQLEAYTAVYDSLTDSGLKNKFPAKKLRDVLTYKETDPAYRRAVDSLFYPQLLPDVTRVLWFDSAGQTLAKWSPYSYKLPLTSVKEYNFFRRIKTLSKQQPAAPQMIVHTGKSNITGEFQVYVAKPARQKITTINGTETTSIGIVLATSLHCNMYPVLPPNFGFCLVDNNGEVLLHSDATRNLAENLFVETKNNSQIQNAVRLKTDSLVQNVTMYGTNHDFSIKGINGQPLTLVVFYPTTKAIVNISRFLHFSIACLFYLFGLIGLFVLYFTYRRTEPTQLKFKQEEEQWIRPTSANQQAYSFAQWYFLFLICLDVLMKVVIQVFRHDFRIILYSSFLVPFYAILGLITANKKLVKKAEKRDYSFGAYFNSKKEQFKGAVKYANFFTFLYDQVTSPFVIPSLLIIGFNAYFLGALGQKASSCLPVVMLLVPQVLMIAALLVCFRISVKSLQKEDAVKEEELSFKMIANRYVWSLYFIVLLVAVLPTFGIATYAFFGEKTQFKKSKELWLATQMERKIRYFKTAFHAAYSPVVRDIDAKRRPDSVQQMQGIYLSDHDSIKILPAPAFNVATAINDEPYRKVVNQMYSYSSPYFGVFATGNHSNDSSWLFAASPDSLLLYYNKGTEPFVPLKVSSYYPSPLQNFRENKGVVFPLVLVAFFIFLLWFLKGLNKRLFLLHLPRHFQLDEDFLKNYFDGVGTDPLYTRNLKDAVTQDSLKKERTNDQEYILQMTFCFAPVYAKIWKGLSDAEKYVLFNLSRNGYTNHKNVDIIYQLLTKGILEYKDYKLRFFSLSFQNYVAGQGDTPKMQEILSQYAVGGVWRSLRVPVLIVAGVVGIFFLLTQADLVHDLTAFIASMAALIPLLIQLIGGSSRKSSSQ